MYSDVSVCLIVKNEEKNIERCLESVIDLTDEIIVVDTGSTDKTIPLCKCYGAKVIEYEWKNDFSDARNKSLEYATKDWILFLDADECLPPESISKIQNIIANKLNNQFKGYYLRLSNVVSGQEIGDSVVFRMFKNDVDHRFSGKMHEQVINSVQKKHGDQSIGSTDVKILHYGYDPDVADLDLKSERNISLLESYDEKDKDGYYHYALGNEYLRIQDFDKALIEYEMALDGAFIDGNRMNLYYPYLITSMFKLFHPNKRYAEELEYIDQFKKKCRDFCDIYFQEALIYSELSCFSKAKAALKKYKSISTIQSNYVYPSNNINQLYDVEGLLNQLESYSISHDDSLLSSIIISKDSSLSLIESIKSLNEISKEVVVVKNKTENDYDLDNSIENFGAKIVYTSSIDEDVMFFEGLFKCRGSYVLKFKDGELCSSISQVQLVKTLENSNKHLFMLPIVDNQNIEINREVRIFKNNRKFKKFDEYNKYINNKLSNCKFEEINIHKIY